MMKNRKLSNHSSKEWKKKYADGTDAVQAKPYWVFEDVRIN